MEFYDLLSFEEEHIADIIMFDDGACVLKFNIFKKIHCFDNFDKLQKALKVYRLGNYKLVKNGVFEDDNIIV